MGGRPNRRNIAAFSNFFDLVWKRPKFAKVNLISPDYGS